MKVCKSVTILVPIEGKTIYKSLREHYYMLTDSRYGEDYYI